MSDTLRCFLAVSLDDEARAAAERVIGELDASLGLDVRWTPAENLHLTLKFLGDVAEDRIPKLAQGVLPKLASEAPFRVELRGVGAFPSTRDARVLWMGVAQGQPRLARIARKLDRAATRVGAERERRPYRAHLTIGRLPTPEPIPLERLASSVTTSFPVEEVVLYESRLASGGATHVPLARLPLGRDSFDSHELAPLL